MKNVVAYRDGAIFIIDDILYNMMKNVDALKELANDKEKKNIVINELINQSKSLGEFLESYKIENRG